MIRQHGNLEDPVHFKHWVWALHHCIGGSLRWMFSAPPQHGKSLVTLWGLIWVVWRHPGLSHAYMTYSVERASEMNLTLRHMLDECGIKYTGTQSALHFLDGTTIRFTSADKGLTGKPITGVLVVDDIYREQQQADSPAYRKRVEIAWPNSVVARLHRGASVLVVGTRWHPQDWYGRLIAEYGYRELRIPAIAEEDDINGRQVGEALFPFLHTLEELLAKKKDMLPTAWGALYQCTPRVRGAGVFQQPGFYSQLPVAGYRGAFGIDLAYTSDTTSDESGCLEMWRVEGTDPARPTFYVVDLWHDRCLIERTAEHLQLKHAKRPAWPMLWRCSGTERGSAQLLKGDQYRLPINIRTVTTDKLVSNTAVAVAWNDGRVLLPDMTAFPEKAEWVKLLLNQCLDFTGSGKEHDDLVDCLGNAHVELRNQTGIKPQTAKSMR